MTHPPSNTPPTPPAHAAGCTPQPCAPAAQHRAYISELEGLVESLWLYASHHTISQLTTAQKDLFANVVDAHHARADVEEGYVGTGMAFGPVQRWWVPTWVPEPDPSLRLSPAH